jgi:hypothetical protein
MSATTIFAFTVGRCLCAFADGDTAFVGHIGDNACQYDNRDPRAIVCRVAIGGWSAGRLWGL